MLCVGQTHGIEPTDVTLFRQSQILADQKQRQRVSMNVDARFLQFLAVGFNRGGPGSRGSGVEQYLSPGQRREERQVVINR